MSNGRNLGLLLGTSTVVPASALTEVSNLVDSDYVTQLSPVKITTANQSFDSNQETLLNLTAEISGVPNVAVFKEVPQTGITSKSNWDVNSTASNYDFYNEATTVYASATVTPSNNNADGILTNSAGTSVTTIDLTSGSSDNNILSGRTYAFTFKPDGTKLYKSDTAGTSYIEEFNLSTAWDLTTATTTGNTFSPEGISLGIRAFIFKPDGTKFWIGTNQPESGACYLYEHNLSTAWDLSTASYNNVKLQGNPADYSVTGAYFNSDGTRLWTASNSTNSAYEFSLTSGWDITTASYVKTIAGYIARDARYITFNPDGTKWYYIHYSDEKVVEVDLQTPFDLTSAPNLGTWVYPVIGDVEYNISTQIVSGLASGYIDFNTGKFFGASYNQSNIQRFSIGTVSTQNFSNLDIGKRVVGNGGEAIITATDGSYSLVTPFNDTSTITSGNWSLYGTTDTTDGISLSYYENLADVDNMTTAYNKTLGVGGYESRVTGVFLGNSGQNLYISGWTTLDKIAQFSLSAPYDITTASFLGYSPQFPDTVNTWGIHFSPDGTKVYLVSNEYDRVYQYNLTSPWDVTSWTYSGQLLMPNAGSNTANKQPRSCGFGDNGYLFYICDTWGEMFQFSLLTPYDISTATYDNFAVIYGGSGFAFYDNGTRLLSLSSPNDQIRQVILSTPYDISTAGSSTVLKQLSENMEAAHFVEGLYLVSGYYANIRLWNMGSYTTVTSQYIPAITNSIGRINTTSWLDINDMTPDETLNDGEVYYAISTDARTTWKVAKNGEGERSIARNNSGTWQYNSNANETTVYTGYDLDGNLASTLSSFTSISGDTGVTYLGTGFSSDGTNMYAFSPTDYTFYQFTLSTPWDETTASYANKSFTPSSGNNWQVHLIRFDPTGTKMYAGGQGQTRNTLYEYTLSTPWDISTANPTATDSLPTLNVAGVTGEVENIIISPNGSYVYALNYQTGTLHRWTLNTAWNLSSRTSNSPDQTTSSLYTWSTFSWGLDISDDGTKLYVTNGNPVGLGEWSLSPAYSISGLSTSPNTSSAWSGAAYKNLVIGKQGLKLYATGAGGVAHQDMGNSSISSVYGLTETWTNSTYNNEHAALQQALTVSINRMNSTQLSELSDANEFVLGNSLDLMIAPYVSSGASPVSDGVTINYDAEAIIRQAILGTDYIVEQPTPGTIKVVSLTNQNLKIRVL